MRMCFSKVLALAKTSRAGTSRCRLAVALCMLLVVPAGAEALVGHVVEDGSNKPIENAFVAATWTGRFAAIVESRTVCYHIVFERTDKNGRFDIPEFSGNVNPLITDRLRSISVYAPGFNSGSSDREKGIWRMIRRTGSKEKQFQEVTVARTSSCVSHSDRRLLPMYRAFSDELRDLAATTEQRARALRSIWAVDIIEIGEPHAGFRHSKRMEAFSKREGFSN